VRAGSGRGAPRFAHFRPVSAGIRGRSGRDGARVVPRARRVAAYRAEAARRAAVCRESCRRQHRLPVPNCPRGPERRPPLEQEASPPCRPGASAAAAHTGTRSGRAPRVSPTSAPFHPGFGAEAGEAAPAPSTSRGISRRNGTKSSSLPRIVPPPRVSPTSAPFRPGFGAEAGEAAPAPSTSRGISRRNGTKSSSLPRIVPPPRVSPTSAPFRPGFGAEAGEAAPGRADAGSTAAAAGRLSWRSPMVCPAACSTACPRPRCYGPSRLRGDWGIRRVKQ